jgi:hypothetical protein
MADSPEAIQALIAALVEGYRTTKLVNVSGSPKSHQGAKAQRSVSMWYEAFH